MLYVIVTPNRVLVQIISTGIQKRKMTIFVIFTPFLDLFWTILEPQLALLGSFTKIRPIGFQHQLIWETFDIAKMHWWKLSTVSTLTLVKLSAGMPMTSGRLSEAGLLWLGGIIVPSSGSLESNLVTASHALYYSSALCTCFCFRKSPKLPDAGKSTSIELSWKA